MTNKGTGPALLIMAAGRGSRFGGLKQLEPVGPHGEAIMEYSIYDGLASGFTKAVLVIRPEHENLFRERIVDRIAGRVPVVIVHQERHVGSPGDPLPSRREKPWGTAHAVLACRAAISGPFAVLNADDVYGPKGIRAMGAYLNEHRKSPLIEGAMLGYRLIDTLSNHGTVARGICEQDSEGYLMGIVEYGEIGRLQCGEIIAHGAMGERLLRGDELVSLNFWAFPADIFGLLEKEFAFFLSRRPAADQEFEIPTAVSRLIDAGKLRMKILETDEPWCGITYREDVATVQSRLESLIENRVYPERLWDDRQQQ